MAVRKATSSTSCSTIAGDGSFLPCSVNFRRRCLGLLVVRTEIRWKSREEAADVHCYERHYSIDVFDPPRTCAGRSTTTPPATRAKQTLRRKGRRCEGDDNRAGICHTRQHRAKLS